MFIGCEKGSSRVMGPSVRWGPWGSGRGQDSSLGRAWAWREGDSSNFRFRRMERDRSAPLVGTLEKRGQLLTPQSGEGTPRA